MDVLTIAAEGATGLDWSGITSALTTAFTDIASNMGSSVASVLPIALPLMGVPILVRYVRRIFTTAS